jgi:hypothetical protein
VGQRESKKAGIKRACLESAIWWRYPWHWLRAPKRHRTQCLSVVSIRPRSPYVAPRPSFSPEAGAHFFAAPGNDRRSKVTASGILAKARESLHRKERRCPEPRNRSALTPPVTFDWLDPREVSQSCPAETLFLTAATRAALRGAGSAMIVAPRQNFNQKGDWF